jgi:type VI protein secretion system component Hcp
MPEEKEEMIQKVQVAPEVQPDAAENELSATDLENVAGGNKTSMTDFSFVKMVDKSSP